MLNVLILNVPEKVSQLLFKSLQRYPSHASR